MFQKNTVIVVGAGASAEYGLPLGGGLTDIIAKDVNVRFDHWGSQLESGDEYVVQTLRQAAHAENRDPNINRYLPACHAIAAGMSEAQSIDTFIHSRRGEDYVDLVGKLGIVRSILRAEKHSALHFKQGNVQDTIAFNNIQDTWLPKLRKLICDGVRVDGVAERLEKITLVIFNYDRCVEHYLLHSLRNYYSLNEKDAIPILESLTIIHPYGVVGELPWQSQGMGTKYGESEIHNRLLPLIDGIRTFTEQAGDQDLTNSIKSAVDEADLMIFLGFAYHDQNIELLNPKINSEFREVYGTAFGISDPVQKVIVRKLATTFCGKEVNNVTLSSCKCAELFDDYAGVFATC